jgi:hypothetical protein
MLRIHLERLNGSAVRGHYRTMCSFLPPVVSSMSGAGSERTQALEIPEQYLPTETFREPRGGSSWH